MRASARKIKGHHIKWDDSSDEMISVTAFIPYQRMTWMSLEKDQRYLCIHYDKHHI